MQILDLSIYDAVILGSSDEKTKFDENKVTVQQIRIQFKADKYANKISGSIVLDRAEARKLIRELESQLKVRTSKNYSRWLSRKTRKKH